MTESVPIPNGPFPSFTLDPPRRPPRMTREEAIAYIKQRYRYPADMPDDIWRTEYGSLQEWGPPYPSVREDWSPWNKHVWKVTATGERLAGYFIPTNRDEEPDPDIVLGFLIDDGERREYAQSVWHLRRDL